MRILSTTLLGGLLASALFLPGGFRRSPAVVAKTGVEFVAPSDERGTASAHGALSRAEPEPEHGLEPAVAPRAETETPVVENGWAGELRFLKTLAATKPELALATVAKMADKHERKAAAVAVCLVVAETWPELAAQAAWRLDLGRLSDEDSENAALETLAKTWAEADFARALGWAEALPADDESRRDRVMKGVAEAALRGNPELAGQVVAAGISSGDSVHLAAVSEVLRRWAAIDYDEALAWAARFPQGPARNVAADLLANGEPTSESK